MRPSRQDASPGQSNRTFLLSMCLLALVGMPWANNNAQAAPVTFAFEATASEIQGDPVPLALPFQLAVGQQITGRYIFQSAEDLLDVFLHHERGKQGVVSLTIDGAEIEAATNFGLLNGAGIPDPLIPGPTSSIFLDYHSPTDVEPGWPGFVAEQYWSQQLILVGADGTISDSEQILDADVWNQLVLLRRLELRFGYPNTVLVLATVGAVSVVPEPTTIWLMCGILVAAIGTSRSSDVSVNGAIKGVRTL